MMKSTIMTHVGAQFSWISTSKGGGWVIVFPAAMTFVFVSFFWSAPFLHQNVYLLYCHFVFRSIQHLLHWHESFTLTYCFFSLSITFSLFSTFYIEILSFGLSITFYIDIWKFYVDTLSLFFVQHLLHCHFVFRSIHHLLHWHAAPSSWCLSSLPVNSSSCVEIDQLVQAQMDMMCGNHVDENITVIKYVTFNDHHDHVNLIPKSTQGENFTTSNESRCMQHQPDNNIFEYHTFSINFYENTQLICSDYHTNFYEFLWKYLWPDRR